MNSLNSNSAELIINDQKSYLPSIYHVIKEFQTLIPENAELLWLIQKTDKRMSLSAYRKLIKQKMADININPSYELYSLKHAAINKLFNLGLGQSQVNKVVRFNNGFNTL
jgi:hypothetical protein